MIRDQVSTRDEHNYGFLSGWVVAPHGLGDRPKLVVQRRPSRLRPDIAVAGSCAGQTDFANITA